VLARAEGTTKLEVSDEWLCSPFHRSEHSPGDDEH